MSQRKDKCIEAVIFDLDDTLISWSQPTMTWEEHTRPMVDNVYSHLLETGCTLPDREEFFNLLREQVEYVWEEARKDWKGASFREALRLTIVGCALDVEMFDLEELMRVYSWGPRPGVEPYEDALTVLDALHERDYRLGLITNSFMPMWMRDVELRHYNLIDYFDARITSGDAGYMKPHPAIYEHMLEMLQTTPERAVFIGDHPEFDIAGANEAGLTSILIDPPHLQRETDGVVADYTITTLSELLAILEQLEVEGCKQ